MHSPVYHHNGFVAAHAYKLGTWRMVHYMAKRIACCHKAIMVITARALLVPINTFICSIYCHKVFKSGAFSVFSICCFSIKLASKIFTFVSSITIIIFCFYEQEFSFAGIATIFLKALQKLLSITYLSICLDLKSTFNLTFLIFLIKVLSSNKLFLVFC